MISKNNALPIRIYEVPEQPAVYRPLSGIELCAIEIDNAPTSILAYVSDLSSRCT